MMNLRLWAALLILGALSLSAQAQGLNFTFTFTGTSSDPTLNGTITGEVYGLTDNAYSSPTAVTVFSAPAGFGLTGPVTFNSALGFQLVNGQITLANYDVVSADSNYILRLYDNGTAAHNSLDDTSLSAENAGPTTTNIPGTYTLVTPVPEPGRYALLLVLVLVGLVSGKKLNDHRRDRTSPSST